LWAAMSRWPSIASAVAVEASASIRKRGEDLARTLSAKIDWRAGDIDAVGTERADLVSLSYVLGELDEPARERAIERLWAAAEDVLLIVEPGTPAGWQRMLMARNTLIAAGAHLLAPCPHAAVCPLTAPDWCHFSERVARSRIHRLAKSADVPWE